MASLSVWRMARTGWKSDLVMAMIMLPAAFMAPRLLSGNWLLWGLPALMVAMFAIIDLVRVGWRNVTASMAAWMLMWDVLIIVPAHLLLLYMRGAI